MTNVPANRNFAQMPSNVNKANLWRGRNLGPRPFLIEYDRPEERLRNMSGEMFCAKQSLDELRDCAFHLSRERRRELEVDQEKVLTIAQDQWTLLAAGSYSLEAWKDLAYG